MNHNDGVCGSNGGGGESGALIPTDAVTDLSNLSNVDNAFPYGCDEHCSYNNGLNRNGGSNIVENNAEQGSPRRHNSMDRLMGLLNDMGRTQRTRSLSDGGQEEGIYMLIYLFSLTVGHFYCFLLFNFNF